MKLEPDAGSEMRRRCNEAHVVAAFDQPVRDPEGLGGTCHIQQHDIRQHATLNFPKGEAARRYNVLQKLAYLGVLCLLIPVMILSGLAMSPSMDATWPWLLDLFGGRQSARSIHFIAAWLLVLFLLVHLLMVVLAGPFNEIRSMVTGYYRLPREKD